MRLTADLVREALSYINPLGDRELDLRGNKIPAIENLGVAGGHDSIDFTDNDIMVLGNLPLSTRLHTLLLARNRIQHIQPTLAKSIPRLKTLVLASNNISELADIDPLAECRELTHLVLTDNLVTKKENYRLYVLFRIPQLNTLDYSKIRDVERAAARDLFGTAAAPTQLALQASRLKTDAPLVDTRMNGTGEAAATPRRIRYTKKQARYFDDAIRNARSLQEVERLQRDMAEGKLPAHLMEVD